MKDWISEAANRIADKYGLKSSVEIGDIILGCHQSTAGVCDLCMGPHAYDTSVPSVIWNETIRKIGMPDYLCLSCIVCIFAMDERSFSAVLYGPDLHGVPIEVQINSAAARDAVRVQEQNNELRNALLSIADIVQPALTKVTRA